MQCSQYYYPHLAFLNMSGSHHVDAPTLMKIIPSLIHAQFLAIDDGTVQVVLVKSLAWSIGTSTTLQGKWYELPNLKLLAAYQEGMCASHQAISQSVILMPFIWYMMPDPCHKCQC